MSALEVLGLLTVLMDTFPKWAPVLALVTVLLLCQAVRMAGRTEATEAGDTVPAVSGVADGTEDTLPPRGMTCGDIDPRVSHWPGTGGG